MDCCSIDAGIRIRCFRDREGIASCGHRAFNCHARGFIIDKYTETVLGRCAAGGVQCTVFADSYIIRSVGTVAIYCAAADGIQFALNCQFFHIYTVTVLAFAAGSIYRRAGSDGKILTHSDTAAVVIIGIITIADRQRSVAGDSHVVISINTGACRCLFIHMLNSIVANQIDRKIIVHSGLNRGLHIIIVTSIPFIGVIVQRQGIAVCVVACLHRI